MTQRRIPRLKALQRALQRWIDSKGDRTSRQRALEAIGRFRSDATDVAEKHDAYLVAALLAEVTGRDEPGTPRGVDRRNPKRILPKDGDA